jgi:hypothetical protein
MVRFHCVLAFTIFLPQFLFAAEPGEHRLTQFEIRQHLFSSALPAPGEPASLPQQVEEVGSGKKSVGLAVLYSLLLPGLGEYYAGGYGSGKYFSIAEGALWISYAAFDIYGNSLRDDAIEFAVVHAGINPRGKDDQYFVDIGNFINTAQFDEVRSRNREPERMYGNRPGYAWDWGPINDPQSDANRAAYKDQRLSGERVLNNRKFVVAAIIVNHIASAINAARAVISHNKEVADRSDDFHLKADVIGGINSPQGILLTLSKSF